MNVFACETEYGRNVNLPLAVKLKQILQCIPLVSSITFCELFSCHTYDGLLEKVSRRQ